MIHDNIQNASRYSALGILFENAFEFISKNDLTALPLGKHSIAGDDLFVILMEYETNDEKDCKLENHRKYTDIQLMLSGEELMGLKQFNGEKPIVPYDDEKDAAFYEPKYDTLVKVKQGEFTIFFPNDLHMPTIKTDGKLPVRKAVFKVRTGE